MTAETQHSPAEASPIQVLSPNVSLDSPLAPPPLMLQARRRKRFKRTDVSTYPGYMQSSSAFTPTPMGRPSYPNTLYAGIGSGYGSQLTATSPHPAMLHHYQTSAGAGQGQPRMFSIDNIINQQTVQSGQGGDLNSQALGLGLGLGGGDLGSMTSSCSVTGTDPSACFQTQTGNPSANMLSRNSGNLSSNLAAGYPYSSSSASPPNLPAMTQSGFSPGNSQVYCSGNRLSLPAMRPGSCAEHTEQLLGLSSPMNSYNNTYMRQANFASGLERSDDRTHGSVRANLNRKVSPAHTTDTLHIGICCWPFTPDEDELEQFFERLKTGRFLLDDHLARPCLTHLRRPGLAKSTVVGDNCSKVWCGCEGERESVCALSLSSLTGPEEEELWERGGREAASPRMTLGTDMSDSSALSEDVDIDVVGGDISVGKDGKYIHHDFNLDNDSDDNYSQNAAERVSSPGLSSSDCPSDQIGRKRFKRHQTNEILRESGGFLPGFGYGPYGYNYGLQLQNFHAAHNPYHPHHTGGSFPFPNAPCTLPSSASIFPAPHHLPSLLGADLRKPFYPQLSPSLPPLKTDSSAPSRPSFSIDNIIGAANSTASSYSAPPGSQAQILAILTPALASASNHMNLTQEGILQPGPQGQTFSSKTPNINTCPF
ncbi:hypothetical protein FQN60_013335 [Etheostoma spectabile]|uniref:Uncharacterized protein n=1 Tax=Etheostoma spectabile TaxID=54343 RepID=A0A5J5DAQ8_9PERO|nr:hypothetical protein FQN60_013335 [Etheostoma spectabile]